MGKFKRYINYAIEKKLEDNKIKEGEKFIIEGYHSNPYVFDGLNVIGSDGQYRIFGLLSILKDFFDSNFIKIDYVDRIKVGDSYWYREDKHIIVNKIYKDDLLDKKNIKLGNFFEELEDVSGLSMKEIINGGVK